MKKGLLATTAIVGGTLVVSSAAIAGNVSSGDNYSVRLGGIHRFSIGQYDLDQSTGAGRGYGFKTPFSEVWIKADATADNGIKYGVEIELEAREDAGEAVDEVWAYVDSDQWGRVEMGDQDGAADRMKIAGHNALKGHLGYFGGLALQRFVNENGNFGADTNLSRNDFYENVGGAASSDNTKLIYFTPRFAGFQLGASLTPDTGVAGRAVGELDNDGDINNLWEFGANYKGQFDSIGVIVAATYTTSSDTDGASPANTATEDTEYLTLGAQVTFGGFAVAAGWQDHNESRITTAAAATGADAGKLWNVGVGYSAGPWGVSAGYMVGEKDAGGAAADPKITTYVLGGQYAVAPGWTILADLAFYEHDNKTGGFTGLPAGTTSASSQVFLLTNQFVF